MEGFFINRKDRPKRLEHIEKNILSIPFFSKLKKFEAIIHKEGRIGCSLSHIECLKRLQKLPNDYFLMIEDDLVIKNKHFETFQEEFEKIKDSDWDVIILGGTVVKCEQCPEFEKFYRARFSYTTTAYIIKKSYISVLLENFETSVKNMQQEVRQEYYLDVYWNRLKLSDKWYVYRKSFISQLHDYSDTEHKVINFDRLFATYYLNIMGNYIRFNAT